MTEHEVERLVVRLIGDQTSYQKMLKDVKSESDSVSKELKKHSESIGKSWTSSFEKMATTVENSVNRIVNAFGRLYRSTQDAMTSVGSKLRMAGLGAGAAGGAISGLSLKGATAYGSQGKETRELIRDAELAVKKAEELKKQTVQGTEAYKELERIIRLTAETASTFKLMSERTGVSIEQLSRTIKTNSDEFKRWEREADSFGLLLGEEATKNADELADSWTRVKQVFRGMWVQIGEAVAPAWKEWNELVEGSIRWVVKWVKENKELIATIAKIGKNLVVVGGVLAGLGTAITTLGAFLGPIIAGLSTALAAWVAWDTAMGKGLRQDASKIWKEYGTSVKNAAQAMVTYGKEITDYTSKIITGTFDAIKAGNLELAVEILWSGVKVAWAKALTEIDKLTGKRFGAIFQNLAAGDWHSAAQAALNEILTVWNKILLAVNPVIAEIKNKMDSAWTWIVNTLDTAGVTIQNTAEMISAWFKDAANNVMRAWTLVKSFFIGMTSAIGGLWQATMGKIIAGLTAVGGVMAGSSIEAVKAAVLVIKTINAPAVSGLEGALKGLGVAAETGYASTEAGLGMMKEARKGLGTSFGWEHSKRASEAGTKRWADLKGRTEERTAASEARQEERMLELLREDLAIKAKLINLEAERKELEEAGKTAAAEKLAQEKANLEAKLAQAQAEREKMEAERASHDQAIKNAQEIREIQERNLRLEEQRRNVVERWDPVEEYRRKMKELNALFENGKKYPEIYRKAVEQIEEELAEAQLRVTIDFGITGMDAVRSGTREHQQLVENTLMQLEKEKAKRQALAEAKKRDAQAEKEAEEAKRQAEEEERQRRESPMVADLKPGVYGPEGVIKSEQDLTPKERADRLRKELDEYNKQQEEAQRQAEEEKRRQQREDALTPEERVDRLRAELDEYNKQQEELSKDPYTRAWQEARNRGASIEEANRIAEDARLKSTLFAPKEQEDVVSTAEKEKEEALRGYRESIRTASGIRGLSNLENMTGTAQAPASRPESFRPVDADLVEGGDTIQMYQKALLELQERQANTLDTIRDKLTDNTLVTVDLGS